jgi:deoxyadenosine/deoxycytidine kinase
MSVLYPYIAIEGVIGVGKTSLATMLADTFEAKLLLERFESNPFLERFYQDQERYAFMVEMHFMAERFMQLKSDLLAPDLFHNRIISDYITEKSLIFAGKTLPEDVFNLYSQLFLIFFSNIPKPDLLVYLYATPEKLRRNIDKRGRDYEKNITIDYLDKLQTGYMEYFKSIPNAKVLIVNTNEMDFVNNPDDYQKICNHIFQEYPVGVTIIE